MMKVDGERTRGESERESERERDRESEKEREMEREEDRGRERERGLSKAKDSYFGVSEATLFETVFEIQNNYKKDPTSVVFRLF